MRAQELDRSHPGGRPGANLKSISHKCDLREVAFAWELTKETIHLPLGCLQGRIGPQEADALRAVVWRVQGCLAHKNPPPPRTV